MSFDHGSCNILQKGFLMRSNVVDVSWEPYLPVAERTGSPARVKMGEDYGY